MPNQPAGAFWAVLNRLFIIGQAVVLILSELGFPSKFFETFFPVLGKEFGLGALGLIQMLYVPFTDHPPPLTLTCLLELVQLSFHTGSTPSPLSLRSSSSQLGASMSSSASSSAPAPNPSGPSPLGGSTVRVP